MRKNKGFTVLELLIVCFILAIIVIGFGFIGVGCMGNYWYTRAGVLEKIQVDHPQITKIVTTDRNIWGYSKIITEDKDGKRYNFLLDTNILFNYNIIPE